MAVRNIDGVLDAVPGHRTLLLEIDPSQRDEISQRVRSLAFEVNSIKGRLHLVPITYDGPDVDWVCGHLRIHRDELTARHSGKTYDVRMLGSPEFVYLSSVVREIAVPRQDDPRLEVPAGSVGIGGRQTGIYARARPGGWRLIGQVVTELPTIAAGDRVRFQPK